MSKTKETSCKGRIKMNFDCWANISRKLAVGEINNSCGRHSILYGQVSQTVSSRLDYHLILKDQKQLKTSVWLPGAGICRFPSQANVTVTSLSHIPTKSP